VKVSSRVDDLRAQPAYPRPPAPRPELEADARCIAAVLAGERERFSELVERYKDAVAAVVRGYVRDPHAAEDEAQEIFLKAFSALGQLRDPRLFLPWLLQIARYRLQATGRGDGGRKLASLDVELAAQAPGELERDRTAMVLRCLAELPEPGRRILILKYQRNLSCKVIAELEGLPIGTVTSRLARGLAMLRESLKNCGIE
jgi:RNA polymerase sigma-70 factor (ECF subfamily)